LAVKLGLLLAAAYLVGAIPLAFLIVKWRYGEDIRHRGTGGVGAANVFKSFSKPLGVLIFFYDIGKGVLMVWVARWLGLTLSMQVAVGLAVIAGHNWPIFLRFNAGRGLATTIGVALYLFPWGIWFFIAGAAFTLILGSSPLPVLVGVVAMPVASLALAVFGAVNLWSAAGAHALPGKPHVILLGIDSLRLDELRRFGGQSERFCR